MILTADQIKLITPGTPISRINTFVYHLNTFLPQYKIDTPIEVCSFLAQVFHESGGLKYLREIWGPTAAQLKYEGRKDLGNIYAGDGKKFMGRGLVQITGRANYSRMSMDMFKDHSLLENPDLLATPEFGTQSACIYWTWKNLDAYDDDDNILKETKLINGGYNGLDDRQAYFDRAKNILIG